MKRIVLLGAAVLLAACWSDDHPSIGVSPECGHDLAGDSSQKLAEVSYTIDVPEFNDCQRFIVNGAAGLVYDSLFAVVATQNLNSLESRLPVGSLPPGNATTVVAPTVRTATVAVIYADGAYEPLGIEPDRNCLYMWRTLDPGPAPQLQRWFARMVPIARNVGSCPDIALSDLGAGKSLQVSRVQVAGFTNDVDYPPVARWDWDSTHVKQYIGIKCGAAWCEVSDGALASSEPLPVPPGASPALRRVRLIKGWYDQQFLATAGPGNTLVPSHVKGTIVPDTLLGQRTVDDFKAGHVQVADISLASSNPTDPALAVYRNKFNFTYTSIMSPTTLTIRDSLTSAGLWGGSVRSPVLMTGPSMGKAIKRREVSPQFTAAGYVVPAVARWRWMKTDEGTWTRCDAGCCEMSDYVF